MNERRPDVSVVVLNHNGRQWLDRCLSALRGQEGVAVESILVDNGSSDGSVAFVEERFPSVRLLRLEGNLGFSGGNNAGAALARAPLVAFLNNDTEADPRWAAALKAALDADQAAGLATSRIVRLGSEGTIDSAGDGYTRAGGAYKRGHGQAEALFREAGEVFGACGAAFMIRRALFEELAGFDSDFFLVYEDVDLSYRAQLAGYRCLYVPDALVHHAWSATLGRVSPTSVFYGQRNLEWVYVKDTPWPLLLATLPAHLAYSLAGGVYHASIGQSRAWVSAKAAALAGLPRMVRKRAAIQRGRRASARHLWRLMDRGWLARKWREKHFDLGTVPSR